MSRKGTRDQTPQRTDLGKFFQYLLESRDTNLRESKRQMGTSQHDNPYQSPGAAEEAEVSPDTVLERASLAWTFPLIGFLLFTLAGYLVQFRIASVLSLALLVATIALWIGGIVMTVYGIRASRQYPHAFSHALIGGICSVLLTGSIVLGLFSFAYQPQS